jgi:hypothetical protein
MKLAICLFGISFDEQSSVKRKRDYKESLKHIQENIISFNKDTYDVDFFFHSWENSEMNTIIDSYQPKSYIFEKQKYFINVNGVPVETDRLRESLQVHNCQSMFYSIKRALELKKDYETQNNFEYDMVLLSRFDCIYLIPLDLMQINKDNIYFMKTCKYYLNDVELLSDSPYLMYYVIMHKDTINKAKLTYYKNVLVKICGQDIKKYTDQLDTLTVDNIRKQEIENSQDEASYGVPDWFVLTNSQLMDNFSTIFINIYTYGNKYGFSGHNLMGALLYELGLQSLHNHILCPFTECVLERCYDLSTYERFQMLREK